MITIQNKILKTFMLTMLEKQVIGGIKQEEASQKHFAKNV